jgi:DNA-binding beta-propeller fold protein YncE
MGMRSVTAVAASLALVATALAGAATVRAAGESVPLRLVANVPLPGPSNRFDYVSLDPTTNRLYIAHMNAGQLLVFDTRRRRVVRTIAAPGVHGVIAVPQLHRVYASATDARQLFTIDSRTGRILRRAPAGSYPDGLAYDPAERHVFVSDESGGIEAVFDAAGHRIGTVRLGGEAGNVQYDPGSRRILVDVQSRDQVAVIDPRSNVVVRRVALPGCDHPHGLYVDAPRRLAFVACDSNARLLTLNLGTMKVTGTAPVGSSPDVLAFDTSSRRLYVSAESGVVAVLAERGRALRELGQGLLAPYAHTVAVDSTTHLVYFPLQSGSAGRPQLRIMAPTP